MRQLIALAVMAVIGGACSSGPGRAVPTTSTVAAKSTPTSHSTVVTTTRTAVATTTSPAPAGTARYAVGTLTHEFVDASRGRSLRTIVHFPATGQPGAAGSAPVAGAFPLVFMAHGFRLPADGYERILDAVAAAGFIVVAPAFPHTSPDSAQVNRADIVNQPADLSFLIGAVTSFAATHPDLLPAVSDPGRVAGLGHSDGGLTVSAWAYNNLYRDRRVTAAVVFAGGIGLFPGTYFAPDSPPLLAVHATGDQVNPYSASVNLFDAVPAGVPKFFLTIEGGSHLGPYMYGTAMPVVAQVVVDFLEGYFVGDPAARARLPVDGRQPGLILRSGP